MRIPRWVYRRWVQSIGYLLMAAAGVCAVLWPTPAVEEATNRLDTLIVVWAAFLGVGGLLCAFGAFTDRWIGEFIGLPLLSVVFAVYGIGALARAPESGWTSLAGGLVFMAITCGFAGRWKEILLLQALAIDHAGQREEAREAREEAGDG